MIKQRRMQTAWGDKVFVGVNSLLLTVIFIVTLYPMIFVLSASLSSPTAVSAGKMVLFPVGLNVNGYKRIFGYAEVWMGYANTLFYTTVGTLLNLFATLPCAYALSRRDLYGRGAFMAVFIVTMYFSGGLIPAYINIRDLNLINTRTVILISGLVSAYNIIVSRTFFTDAIPWELHEAATIDGCRDFKLFTSIILPLSKPIIIVMVLYYGVGHWNQYFNAMIYLKDRTLFPLQLFLREILIQSKISADSISEMMDAEQAVEMAKQQDIANQLKYGLIVVSTIPMLIIYPNLQKYFAKGVMIGSVKG